jgi:hypothetical protein
VSGENNLLDTNFPCACKLKSVKPYNAVCKTEHKWNVADISYVIRDWGGGAAFNFEIITENVNRKCSIWNSRKNVCPFYDKDKLSTHKKTIITIHKIIRNVKSESRNFLNIIAFLHIKE